MAVDIDPLGVLLNFVSFELFYSPQGSYWRQISFSRVIITSECLLKNPVILKLFTDCVLISSFHCLASPAPTSSFHCFVCFVCQFSFVWLVYLVYVWLTVSKKTAASLLDSLILSVTVYLQPAVAFFFKGKNQVRTRRREAVYKYVFQRCRKSPNELRMCSLRLIWRWFVLAGMRDKQTEAPAHVEWRSDSTLWFSSEMYESYFISLKKGGGKNSKHGLGGCDKAAWKKPEGEYISWWFYHLN